MKAKPQARIDSSQTPSPMAIIGATLAQGAMRCLDRQKREQKAAAQIRSEDSGSRLSTSSGSTPPPS